MNERTEPNARPDLGDEASGTGQGAGTDVDAEREAAARVGDDASEPSNLRSGAIPPDGGLSWSEDEEPAAKEPGQDEMAEDPLVDVPFSGLPHDGAV